MFWRVLFAGLAAASCLPVSPGRPMQSPVPGAGLPTVDAPQSIGGGRIYYISPAGNDDDEGTVSAPFKTIQHAADLAGPGDIIYVRGGIYIQPVDVSHSGTDAARILVSGYPGETAILDGREVIPYRDGAYPLLLVSGDYVTVQDLTVRNAYGVGLQLQGNYGQAFRIKSYRNWSTGIRVTAGAHNLVQDSEIYWNCRNNDRTAGHIPQSWGAGLSANGKGVVYTIFRANKVWNNWGEGMSTFDSHYTLMEGNIVWDNYANNIYLSGTRHATARGNLAYFTPNNATSGYGGAQTNIELGDEVPSQISSDNTVINNLVLGGSRVFSCCTGATNNIIANNTFVNAFASGVTTVQIWRTGTYTNAQFVNNIIEQDDGVPISRFSSGSALKVSNNLWSKAPPPAASSPSDVIANPQLAKAGPTDAGRLRPNWFRLLSTSPAINRALSLPEVADDFFKAPRCPSPDIGAHEYGPVDLR